jgi:hypothetical protein
MRAADATERPAFVAPCREARTFRSKLAHASRGRADASTSLRGANATTQSRLFPRQDFWIASLALAITRKADRVAAV